MNGRIFAVLFAVIFAVGIAPLLLSQSSGSASAWLTIGFMQPIGALFHVVFYVGIGILSAWLGAEAVALVPLCAALMLTAGVMMQMDARQFPAMHQSILAVIILFAFSVSMLRNKAFLLVIAPMAAWAYFAGGAYMQAAPASPAALYFLQGILINATLMMAIGICIGITLSEPLQASLERLRHFPAVSSFLSLF